MRTLLLGDTHVTGRNPKARLDHLPSVIWVKFKEIREIIKEEKVDLVLIPGDVFDYPYQSYKILLRLHFMFKSFKVPVGAVYGQHDLIGRRLEDARDTTALGALSKLGSVTILTDQPLKIRHKRQDFHIYGASCEEPIPEIQDIEATNILVIHRMIAPRKPWTTAKEGRDYDNPEVLYDKDWYDLVLCGDWHGQFYWRSKADTHVVNPGAFIRKTGGYEDYDRHPCVGIWDSIDNDIQEYLLGSAKPSEQVLTREHIESTIKHTKGMTEFTNRLKAGGSNLGPGYLANVSRQMVEMRRKEKLPAGVERKILEALEANHYLKAMKLGVLDEPRRKKKKDRTRTEGVRKKRKRTS